MEQHGNVVFPPPFEYIQVGNNTFMLNVEVNNHKSVCVCVYLESKLFSFAPPTTTIVQKVVYKFMPKKMK